MLNFHTTPIRAADPVNLRVVCVVLFTINLLVQPTIRKTARSCLPYKSSMYITVEKKGRRLAGRIYKPFPLIGYMPARNILIMLSALETHRDYILCPHPRGFFLCVTSVGFSGRRKFFTVFFELPRWWWTQLEISRCQQFWFLHDFRKTKLFSM